PDLNHLSVGKASEAEGTSSKSRPFWSVIIPTFRAKERHLEAALRSVIEQDQGADQMEIEVADNCSPEGAPVELVHRLAGDRVTIHQEPVHLEMARMWNCCVARARGEWVHLLHH